MPLEANKMQAKVPILDARKQGGKLGTQVGCKQGGKAWVEARVPILEAQASSANRVKKCLHCSITIWGVSNAH